MTEFTPISSLLGGMLIGAASALLLLANGRIAGISGIAGGIVSGYGVRETQWRMSFVGGMVACGAVLAALWPEAFEFGLSRSWYSMAVAGLLVGVGTRVGNGCTSGHGVCGLSRTSPRSLAATMTFMLAGVVTVFVLRSAFGGSL